MSGPDWISVGRALEDGRRAAEDSLKAMGVEKPQLVLNVAWLDDQGREYAAGSPVPRKPHPMLGDSLEQSASEAS